MIQNTTKIKSFALSDGVGEKVPFEKKGRERFLEKLREAELEMEREEEEDVRESFLIWDGRVSHEHETDAAIFFSMCK